MTEQEIEAEKRKIDAMSQEDMARLWRFAPSGHPYFITGTPLCKYFKQAFKGFTPGLSKAVGWKE